MPTSRLDPRSLSAYRCWSRRGRNADGVVASSRSRYPIESAIVNGERSVWTGVGRLGGGTGGLRRGSRWGECAIDGFGEDDREEAAERVGVRAVGGSRWDGGASGGGGWEMRRSECRWGGRNEAVSAGDDGSTVHSRRAINNVAKPSVDGPGGHG